MRSIFQYGKIAPLQDTKPTVALERAPEGACLQLRGTWGALALAEPGRLERLQRELAQATAQWTPPFDGVLWDLRQLHRLDHTGAQLLWNIWGQTWPARLELLDEQRAILERVKRYTVPAPAVRRVTLRELFFALGAWLWKLEEHVAGMLRLVGQLVLDLGRFARAPRAGPWRDLSGHLYHIGVTALPITAMVGFLIGVVLAYLMALQLRQFGASTFIVNVLGLTLIRELGPVLAAILIAGRSGSAITAQIGVMRVNEELDAMRVMGIPKGFRLVMPRVLAMAIAMPLLAVWTTIAALSGGVLAADLTLGISPAYFMEALPKAVQISNLWLATGKSAVFGVVIALIGCHFGLRVLPNTQSLGQGTTASVVVSITMVLLVDALFALLFKGLGI